MTPVNFLLNQVTNLCHRLEAKRLGSGNSHTVFSGHLTHPFCRV